MAKRKNKSNARLHARIMFWTKCPTGPGGKAHQHKKPGSQKK